MKKIIIKIYFLLITIIMILSLKSFAVSNTEDNKVIKSNLTIDNNNIYKVIEESVKDTNTTNKLYNSVSPLLTNDLKEYIISEVHKANVLIDLNSYNLKFDTENDMVSFVGDVFLIEDIFGVSKVKYGYMTPSDEDTQYKLSSLEFTYFMTADEIKSNQTIIDGIVSDFIDGADSSWNDLEKALYTNNYLCKKCKYDDTLSDTSHNIYAALVKEQPVCDGYSKAFIYLGKKIGLNAIIATSESMNHAWNLVSINDNYYNVDVTWNDTTYNNNGKTTYKYFLKSDNEFKTIEKKHSNWVADYEAIDTKFDTNTIWENVTNYLVSLDNYWYIVKGDNQNSTINLEQYDISNIDSFEKNTKTYIASAQSYEPSFTTDGKNLYIATNKNIYRCKYSDNTLKNVFSNVQEGEVFYSINYFNNKFTYDISNLNNSTFNNDNILVLTNNISINNIDTKLAVNDEKQLSVTLSPEDANTTGVLWETTDNTIISVDSNGLINALNPGSATISATNATGEKDSITFNVLSETDYNIKGIELSNSSLTMKINDEKAITGNYINKDESKIEGKFSWNSSNELVASVDLDGNITAVGPGTCTITATYLDFTKTCTIVVYDTISSVEFENSKINIAINKTVQLDVIFTPNNNIDKTLIWTSDDESIATVDDTGVVTAVGKGKTNINVETVNGKKIACEVNVLKPITNISFKTEIVSLDINQTYTVETVITPIDADIKTLSWKSSNESIATVSADGVITALSSGSCKITATSSDGLVSASITVGVKKQATSVKLNKANLILDVNNTYKLLPEFNDGEMSETISSWKSSNDNYVTVDSNGNVTAIAYGEATITATTVNGLTATCLIKVQTAPKGISLNITSYDIGPEQSYQLVATVDSDSSINNQVEWSSSNPDLVTVDSTGKATAHKKGTVTITASTVNGLIATCEMRVIVVVRTVNVSPSNAEINKGSTIQLSTVIVPTDVDDKSITWSSATPDIVSVDANGLVTGLEAGVGIVKATSKNGKVGMATINVLVYADSISINNNDEKVSISIKQKDYPLVKNLVPSNSTSKVSWKTSNPDIVTVDQNGNISAVSAGEAVVTATTDNGKEDTIIVRVFPVVSTVDLNTRNVEMEVGVNYPLTYTLYPNDIENYMTWKSKDESIVTVSNDGVITGISEGETEISCIAENGVMDVCIVKVSNTINYSEYTEYQESYGNIIVIPLKSKVENILNETNFPCLSEDMTVEVLRQNNEPISEIAYVPSFAKIIIKDSFNVTMKEYQVAVKGDISGNGQIKLYDAFTILRKVLKNEKFEGVETIVGDFSGNKQVKLYDAFQFLKLALRS